MSITHYVRIVYSAQVEIHAGFELSGQFAVSRYTIRAYNDIEQSECPLILWDVF